MENFEQLHKKVENLEQTVDKLKDEIEVLLEIAAVIGRSRNFESAVTHILEVANKVIPFDMASLQRLEGNHLQVIGGRGFLNNEDIKKLRFPYPEEGSLSTFALTSGNPVLSKDVESDFPQFVQPPGEYKIKSWMGIPLIMNNQPIGMVSLDSSMKYGFSEHHLKLAALIATPLAIALENARMYEKTFHMAMTDALTHLGSRYLFEMEGRLLLEKARRDRCRISVVMLDIDKFKLVNDTYGHKAGDELLVSLADFLSREADTTRPIFRLGGDEFVLLYMDIEDPLLVKKLKGLSDGWAETCEEEKIHPVTLSFGAYSTVPENDITLDSLVNKADKALYDSKRNGRNRITMYQE